MAALLLSGMTSFVRVQHLAYIQALFSIVHVARSSAVWEIQSVRARPPLDLVPDL